MYLSVPLFSLQGLNGKREGGVILAIVAGIKNLKKKIKLERWVHFPTKTMLYIVARFYGTINKAEYFNYDFWAVLGT